VFLADKNVDEGGPLPDLSRGQPLRERRVRVVADLFLDKPIEKFGNPQPCKGPLPGLTGYERGRGRGSGAISGTMTR
jgi:hypothetical protein